MKISVDGCYECPFSHWNDYKDTFECWTASGLEADLGADPSTPPDWCPLGVEDFTISLNLGEKS